MSGYIVDPMWFYWLQVSSGGRMLLMVLSIITISIIAFIMIFAGMEGAEDFGEIVKKLRKYIILGSIGLFISLLLPSEETLIRMEIAKNATYENVEVVMEEITNAADHIIEELKED